MSEVCLTLFEWTFTTLAVMSHKEEHTWIVIRRAGKEWERCRRVAGEELKRSRSGENKEQERGKRGTGGQ